MPICVLSAFQKLASIGNCVFKMLNALKNGLLF